MHKTFIGIGVIVAVLIVAFFALNSYIRHEELTGGLPQDVYEGWTTGHSGDLTFRYPETLDGTYYTAAEWPPVLTTDSGYQCDLGEAIGLSIEEHKKDGVTYCRTISAEGAAGSTYKSYEYLVGMYKLSFTVRYPQCDNYDEPNRGACKTEQEGFDVDALAIRIFGSVQ